MAWYRAVLHAGGALADRYRVANPSVIFGLGRVMARAVHGTGTPQMLQQLFFQSTAGLYEETTLNGIVRHVVILVILRRSPEPSRNLRR